MADPQDRGEPRRGADRRPELRSAGVQAGGLAAVPAAAAARVLLRHHDHAGVPVQPARRRLPADRLREAVGGVEVPPAARRVPLHPAGRADGDVLQPAQGVAAARTGAAAARRGQGRLRHDRAAVLLPREHHPVVHDRDDHRRGRAARRPGRPVQIRMRIALVGPTHPYKGGVAQHTTTLARQLGLAGHVVDLVSWSAQYPGFLYPGEQRVPEHKPEVPPWPRTTYPLAWYRPDGWWRVGRDLRWHDLVVLVLVTPLQAPAYLAILA